VQSMIGRVSAIVASYKLIGGSMLLGKNDQMPVLPVLGLHIQGPNGPKAYMSHNIYILV
jgi:hypothetical protein